MLIKQARHLYRKRCSGSKAKDAIDQLDQLLRSSKSSKSIWKSSKQFDFSDVVATNFTEFETDVIPEEYLPRDQKLLKGTVLRPSYWVTFYDDSDLIDQSKQSTTSNQPPVIDVECYWKNIRCMVDEDSHPKYRYLLSKVQNVDSL